MERDGHKRGRKPLNLTEEEWANRRRLQRRQRSAKRKNAKREKDIIKLVTDINMLKMYGKTTDEIVANLMENRKLTIKYSEEEQSISGYDGGRIRRSHAE